MSAHPILLDVPASLETERLLLRRPRPGEGAVVHEAVAESLHDLRRFIASVPWVAAEPSVEASETYCRTAFANFAARVDFPYLVFRKADLRLVASVGLHRPVWATPKLEVGYWCRSSETGKGYVTEALGGLLGMAQAVFKPVRVELIVDAQNTRSRAVAQRLGFTLEGVMRHERRGPDGVLRDTCLYALLGTG